MSKLEMVMSRIENLLYSALEHGKRDDLLNKVSKIRNKYPRKSIEEVYDEAYQIIMNT